MSSWQRSGLAGGGVSAGLSWAFAAAVGIAACCGAAPAGLAIQPEEMHRRDRWLSDRLLSAAQPDAAVDNLAFSFIYAGQPSAKLLGTWQRKTDRCEIRTGASGRTRHTVTWTDPKTKLEVRCVAVEYADFPAVEWTVYFKNGGNTTTPLLEHLRAIDSRIERGAEGEFLLKYHKGDTCAPDLYQPQQQVLGPKSHLRQAPHGGRGTNFAFPYYNLTMPGGGMFIVVGWPGQWAATFDRDDARALRVTAGQEQVHLMLRPGEEIRTPLIALMFYQGDDAWRTQNLWRRWMIAHNLPRNAEGKLPPPIMPGNTSLEFNEMCDANEENQKHFLDRYAEERVKIDFWWMDAGWYPCQGWPQTGTWEPDLKRFPKGLRAISDHARAKGIKTLVWFEPERVAGGTWLSQNHPEWLLGGTLLNLGNPAARQWLTDHVDRVLREQGIDLYRQDFNMDPLGFWRNADAPDRQGMTENLHVQGYLAYWDALRQRHPNLVIDSCASGGRRNDLETMRRAVPLHPTDYNYAHLAAKQAFHHSLFHWIPYFGSNTVPVDTVDAYGIRSGHALSVVLGYDLRRKDLDYALLRRLTDETRQIARYYYGDFYPLLPYSVGEDAWIAWQFHRPETGDGLIEAFRRPRNLNAAVALKLGGLDPQAVYEVKNQDGAGSAGTTRASGRELIERGLNVSLGRRQAAALLYRRVNGLAAVISASREKCEILEPVSFRGDGSCSPQGQIATYRWDLGDGTIASGQSVEHAYKTPGSYTIKLTVTDRQGAADCAAATLTVTPVDTVPPAIVAVAAGTPEKVTVVFNKPVAQATAQAVTNYAVDRDVKILAAALEPDQVTVVLRTTPLSKDSAYTLTAERIQDLARTPHTIAAGSRHVLQYRGLYGWWKLDEGQGGVAQDASGNGRHGALVGGAVWATDARRGAVLKFNGADGYVETDTFLPDLTLPFSISLWVNPAPTQVVHADILGNHGEPFVGINLQQDAGATNCFGFGYGDGRKWQGTGTGPALKPGQWQHLAVVCDGESSILYVDGVEKSRGPGKGPLAANPSQNFKLGQGYHSGRYFHGALSDVRLYRHALTAGQIGELAK